MKTALRSHFLLVVIAVVAGCAGTPKLTEDEVLTRYERVALLDQRLQEAAAQGVPDLAPTGYSRAQAHYAEAVGAAAAGRPNSANGAANAGIETLNNANERAAISRDILREVIEVRKRAAAAGAAASLAPQSAVLEKDFRKLANLVERGRLEDAKQRRPALLAGYERLELAALKQGTVEAAVAAIAAARERDAMKFAPKTFKLATEEMRLAESVLEADRTHTAKADAHARRARFLAEKSAAITELIKDFERRDYTREDTILWYQEQLGTINAPLATQLPVNKSNRDLVLGLQQSIRELKQQRDDTAAQRSQYEQELSLTAEQRAAVDKVQSLFSPAEARVYQQQRNVLISAHGFRFPSGRSEIGPDNFALMNRIIQAVQTFPQSYIEISGHTDSAGTDASNKRLSQARADNVARFLVEVGNVPASRIIATGYGEERPVASNESPDGRAANRRVEVLINNN